jgi:large subunit ribosomal protein L6
MSRIGKKPITLPSGVDVTVDGRHVTVKGSKGTLEHTMPETITITREGEELIVARANDERQNRALHGLTRSLIANMVDGVANGFEKELDIVGVGYRAQAQGSAKIELQLGYSHSITVNAPDGVTFETPAPTKIIVRGIDKQQVGQVAADIRKLRKPEPYKGKGVRYANERVLRKAGKSAK